MQVPTQKAVTCAKPETVEEERLCEAMCQTGAGEPRSAKNRGMNIRRSRLGRVPTGKRRLPKGYKPGNCKGRRTSMGEQEQGNHSREGVKRQEERKWYSLMDKIWAKPSLEEAFKEVKRNRGAAGVDRMTIKAFESELEYHLEVVQQTLKNKTYRPKPVRQVYIPKADGTQRPLGIPTVGDRVVQGAARRILEPIFEAEFMDCSFGFRPGRSAHMALQKIRQDLEDGYRYVIDADLKAYFDTIPHERLIAKVKETVVDGSVLSLLEKISESRNHGRRQFSHERARNAARRGY